MNLPGSAKTHVWVGLVLALAGVLVGGYAYTGERIYRIQFLPLALFGLVLVLGGSTLAGYGQANRPRLGGPQNDDEPSFFDRLRERVATLTGSDDGEAGDEQDAEASGEDASEDEDQAPEASEQASDEPTDEDS